MKCRTLNYDASFMILLMVKRGGEVVVKWLFVGIKLSNLVKVSQDVS
jgi:hypothetical protein